MVEKITVRKEPSGAQGVPVSAGGAGELPDGGLLAALKKQLECLVSLGKLAENQRDFIQQDRTEELLALLLERQKVVEELARLEDTIGPMRRNWQVHAGAFPPAAREWAEGAFAEAKARLGKINESDQHDTFILQQRKHQIGGQLGQVGQSQRVTRGYMPAGAGKSAGQLNITE
jgi:hypothetical protein